MPLRLLLLLLWLWGLQWAETDSEGQTTTGELYQRWEHYGQECQKMLETTEPPSGLACNGSFDMYACWNYTAANTTARVSCPWYLPWFRQVSAGFVFRQCGSDGQWGSWRDHTQCENPEKNGAFQDQTLILERLQIMYTVGYSLSLTTLLLALLILSLFRRLHCTRNYIHMNLFTSFMLRAAAILTRDQLLPPLGPYTGDQAPTPWNQINFLIFIRILGILVSKLRTRQMRCPDYRLRLARSTLTLVPLLGVHEVVFAPVTEEQVEGSLRFAKLAFEIFLSSFQGFLVSVLYCFINKEVQSEIRQGWRHRRLRLSLQEQRPRPHQELAPRAVPLSSACREAAVGNALPSGMLHVPGDEVLESYC